jgi:hypothetical protein
MKFDYKNPLWIIALILIIAGGIYLVLEGLPKRTIEPVVEVDAAYDLLEQIEKETGITFSSIRNRELPWRMGGVANSIINMMISGKTFSQIDLTEEERDSIYFFFTENDWLSESYIADMENIGRVRGYEKEGLICLIEKGAFNEGDIRSYSDSGMIISCGVNPQYPAPEEETNEAETQE